MIKDKFYNDIYEASKLKMPKVSGYSMRTILKSGVEFNVKDFEMRLHEDFEIYSGLSKENCETLIFVRVSEIASSIITDLNSQPQEIVGGLQQEKEAANV
ncbi:MAG: hypothetical protein FWC26_00155 [Fibromonadales bacterium]|nr:hypothetical protein [Fibromonadales bacterium]